MCVQVDEVRLYLLVIKLYHVAGIHLPLPPSHPPPTTSTTSSRRGHHVMRREESGSQGLDELGGGRHGAEVGQRPVQSLKELYQQIHWTLLSLSLLCRGLCREHHHYL